MEKALRYNNGKLKWSLVDFKSIEPMVKVLMYGACKYEPFNWKKEMPLEDILDSLQRHVVSLMSGEYLDSESGLPHIGHIICNAMFYEYHYNKQKLNELQEIDLQSAKPSGSSSAVPSNVTQTGSMGGEIPELYDFDTTGHCGC